MHINASRVSKYFTLLAKIGALQKLFRSVFKETKSATMNIFRNFLFSF